MEIISMIEKQNQKFYAQVKNYDKNYWTIADLKNNNIIENFVKNVSFHCEKTQKNSKAYLQKC